MTAIHPIDDFLAAAVRDERPPWPEQWCTSDARALFLERATYHGVISLLLPRSASWPQEIREPMRERSRLSAAWELRHREMLAPLLAELKQRRVPCLFLKGTALAYHVYQEPFHRARADSDLLTRPGDVEAARQALATGGFTAPEGGQTGALQETWVAKEAGFGHAVDLHWAPLNAQYLAPLLSVDECLARAEPLPALADHAAMLDPARFLLHVCIHRNLHRTAPYFSGGKAVFGADRLIWAVDIALLAQQLGEDGWQDFVSLALDKSVARAMLEALDFAQKAAGATVPAEVRSALAEGGPDDRSALLLDAGRRSRVLANLRTAGSWRQRTSQILALLSPSDDAIRARYPRWAKAPRPILLIRRLFDFVVGRAS